MSEKSPLETNKFHESLTSRFSSSEIVVSAILFDVQPIVFSAVKNKSPFNCTNSPIFDFIFQNECVIRTNVPRIYILRVLLFGLNLYDILLQTNALFVCKQ